MMMRLIGVACAILFYRAAEYERMAAARCGPVPSLAEYLLAVPTVPGPAGALERIQLAARDDAL